MTESRKHTWMIVAVALTGACVDISSGGGSSNTVVTVHGTGVLVEEQRAVTGFTSLAHRSEGAVFVEQVVPTTVDTVFTFATHAADGSLRVEEHALRTEEAGTETLIVRAESNLLPYLLTDVQGTVLRLGTAPNVDLEPTLPIEFFLTVTSLESATLEGVGSVEIRDLTASHFAATGSGVGLIELSGLDASQLEVVLGGIGEVRASGTVDQQTVRLHGIGPYNAENLQSREADVRVEGFDSATVRVSERLMATIESSGSVYYIGDPLVEAIINGTGTVEQIRP